VNVNHNIEKLILNLLERLGVAALSTYIGKERLERINETGERINTEILAKILFIEKGFYVFKDKNLRLEILASLGAPKLKEILKLEDPVLENLKLFNDFNWGNNAKSKTFLQLLGLPNTNYFDIPLVVKSSEILHVRNALYSYQNWIRKSINSFLLDSKKRRVIVHMPTGSGKTRTMLEAVCDHLRIQRNSSISVVWLAHSEELCEQAVESFKKVWSRAGCEDGNIVRLWGGSFPTDLDVTMPTFVVASFQTAYRMITTIDNNRFAIFSKIRRSCSLMVVDEAHQSTAPTYQQAIELFSKNTTKIVGLTATPGRHHIGAEEEETVALANFYENNKINIVDDDGSDLEDPISFLTNKGVLAKVYHYQINSGTEIELTELEVRQMERILDIPKSVLKKLGEDAKRTQLIVTHAIKLAIEKNYPTIIFAPSKENSIEIATYLKLKNADAAVITGETPLFERKQSIENFKNGEIPILVNYGVLTTGFDAPNIKAVIVARPTTSVVLYSQMIGRGLRGPLMGGESDCFLVDIKDNILKMPKANHAFTFFDEYYRKT
jgi:superfamily II DNA or RNA helicase